MWPSLAGFRPGFCAPLLPGGWAVEEDRDRSECRYLPDRSCCVESEPVSAHNQSCRRVVRANGSRCVGCLPRVTGVGLFVRPPPTAEVRVLSRSCPAGGHTVIRSIQPPTRRCQLGCRVWCVSVQIQVSICSRRRWLLSASELCSASSACGQAHCWLQCLSGKLRRSLVFASLCSV